MRKLIIDTPVVDPIQRIVAAVCDVLAEEGVTQLSLRKVAAKAGATLGLITHHFPNRAAMVKAAVAETWKRENQVVQWAEVPDKAAVMGAIEVFLPYDEERRRQTAVWVAFWALAHQSRDLQKIHQDVHRFIREKHTVWISALGFSPDRAELLADRLKLFIDGLLLYAYLDPEHWTPERIRRSVDDMIDSIFAQAPDAP
ncbi:TetR family transcriptional regulator [Pseudomonas silvicola]|nr:TetR family transcriptional regulator [Pseudomonas silvicola]